MSGIVERVAMRLHHELATNVERDVLVSELTTEELATLARAAIEAMRETTPGMVQQTQSGYPLTVYRTMIDAALSEGEGGGV